VVGVEGVLCPVVTAMVLAGGAIQAASGATSFSTFLAKVFSAVRIS
jgi:hypothetical protein